MFETSRSEDVDFKSMQNLKFEFKSADFMKNNYAFTQSFFKWLTFSWSTLEKRISFLTLLIIFLIFLLFVKTFVVKYLVNSYAPLWNSFGHLHPDLIIFFKYSDIHSSNNSIKNAASPVLWYDTYSSLCKK